MKKKHYIITGTSRGIGEALAQLVLGADTVVFCISRNQNPRLSVEAHVKGWSMTDIAIDLNDTGKIADMMQRIFRGIEPEDVSEIILINNAGSIHPIRKIGEAEASEKIARAINVNLTAAMLITDKFVRETADWGVPRKVVNLSTGAAIRTIQGWSAYCSAKAGLDMYSRCLVDEQASNPNPVRLVSFVPGVVNTEMQAEVRESTKEHFPELDRFVKLKEDGALLEPEFVAEKLLQLLSRPDFGSQTVVSVHDLP